MRIRTQELPLVYPESNSIGNKECTEYYHLHFIFNGRTSTWGAPAPKREMPGAIEPGLGLNNVIAFHLLLCAGIGNTWTPRHEPAYIVKQEASESSVQSSETATRSSRMVALSSLMDT
ncbi:hypothetical protein AVEN_253818-1 [Araneus ventricosus]|uniref:Uncharacterized protein n=1 Tax=Araneus ventricosus TaxID=182803 RepID=A0A4Y2T4G2_ARAVE|nr:hypothetical protein AVEN_253818-1 [Araneus ventricosus]